MIGIYMIENTVTGKRYIGSSVDIRRRGLAHLSALRSGRHENRYLQASWNKHGEESFLVGVVEECSETDDLLFIEAEYVAAQGHYNICRDVTRPPSRKGQRNSPEHRERCRLANLGKKFGPRPEAWRANIAAGNSGLKRAAEFGRRMSLLMTGRILSPEHREAIRKGSTGKVFTAQHRANMSAAARRRRIAP